MELTPENVSRFCLGPAGVAQTSIRFRGGYRKEDNFESASSLMLDIDVDHDAGSRLSSSEWRAFMSFAFGAFPFRALVYASQHGGAHVFLPLKDPIRKASEYKRQLALTLGFCARALSFGAGPGFFLDVQVKDAARMFFEGKQCDSPKEWMFVNSTEEFVDPLSLPVEASDGAYPSSLIGFPPNPPKRAQNLPFSGISTAAKDIDVTSEGSRNVNCHRMASRLLYDTEGDVEEARARYDGLTSASGLPEFERVAAFESAVRSMVDGGMLYPKSERQREENSLESAYKQIENQLRFEFRKDCDLVESNQIYRLQNRPGGGGIAIPVSESAYKARVAELCSSEQWPVKTQMALKRARFSYFSSDILSSSALRFRKKGEAFFLDGVFDAFTGRFEANSSDFLATPLPFKYAEEEPCGKWAAFLDEVLPPDPIFGFSAEQIQLEDAVRASICGDLDDELAVFCIGSGSNGKSTGFSLIKSAIGETLKTVPVRLLSDPKDRFSWNFLRGGYLGVMNELGADKVLLNQAGKVLFSKDPKVMEIKGGASWSESLLFKIFILQNELPSWTDGADYGLTRKLRVIDFPSTFDGTKQIDTEDPEMVEDVQRWICHCCRRQRLPHYVWEEYPPRKEWLARISDSDIFSELLSPAPGRVVAVSAIVGTLFKAGNQLGKLSNRKLISKLEKCGYEVSRVHSAKVVGCEINTSSSIYQIASNNEIVTSREEDATSESRAKAEKDGIDFDYYTRVADLMGFDYTGF